MAMAPGCAQILYSFYISGTSFDKQSASLVLNDALQFKRGHPPASSSFSLAVTVLQQSSTRVSRVEPAPHALTYRHILISKREVVDMIKKGAVLGLLAAALSGTLAAQTGK